MKKRRVMPAKSAKLPDPAPSETDGTLRDLGKDGQPVEHRVSSPQQAVAIADRFVQDDSERAKKRVKVQGNMDGNAPNSRHKLEQEGRDGESNLNWRMAKGEALNAWTPYFDLIYQVPVCVDGDLDIGDPTVGKDLMTGFATELHRMIFMWDGHDIQTQLRDWQMIVHGVGTEVWLHEIDWRPETVLVSNMYVPDRMRIDFKGGAVLMVQTDTEAGELWEMMESGAPGWQHKAVQECIMKTMAGSDSRQSQWKWDRWQQDFKNGNIYLHQNITKRIGLNTLLVREMSGKISVLIVQGGERPGSPKFLFERRELFGSWNDCVNFYPFDIGADGTYHSIKGLGTEVFPFSNLDNKVRNSLADVVTNGIQPVWQMTTGNEAQRFTMLTVGGNRIAPPGINLLQNHISGNIQPALEVSQDFRGAYARNTGSYNQDVAPPTVEETAKAAMIRAQERGKLIRGSSNRHYCALTRRYKQIWKRAINPAYRVHHPGGEEAVAFREACYRLCDRYGVPHSVLQKVTNIRARRDIGLGSAGVRLEVAAAFMDPNFIDRLDPPGQKAVLRDYAAALTSYQSADSYVAPLNPEEVMTSEDSIAVLENNALSTGGEVVLTPRQDHVIHLGHHVGSMEADVQSLEEGADMRAVSASMEAKGRHANKHLAAIKENPTKKRAATEFAQRLADLAKIQDQLLQNIEEQDAAAPPPPGEPTPEMVKVEGDLALKAHKQQETLRLKAENQRFTQALKAGQAQADVELKDVTTAADIRRKNVAAQEPAESET